MRHVCSTWLVGVAHVLELIDFYRSRCAQILLQVGWDACFINMWKEIVILSSAVIPMHSFIRTYRVISSGWFGSSYSRYYNCHCRFFRGINFLFIPPKLVQPSIYLAHRRFRAPWMYCRLQDKCWFFELSSACKFHVLEPTWREEIWKAVFYLSFVLSGYFNHKNTCISLLQGLSGNWGSNRSQITYLLGAFFRQPEMSLTPLSILHYIALDPSLFWNVMTLLTNIKHIKINGLGQGKECLSFACGEALALWTEWLVWITLDSREAIQASYCAQLDYAVPWFGSHLHWIQHLTLYQLIVQSKLMSHWTIRGTHSRFSGKRFGPFDDLWAADSSHDTNASCIRGTYSRFGDQAIHNWEQMKKHNGAKCSSDGISKSCKSLSRLIMYNNTL